MSNPEDLQITTAAWAFRLGPDDLDDAARRLARTWWWFVVGGLALVVLGILLLVNINGAVTTLALLIALALLLDGIEQIMNASRFRPRWPGYVLGGLYLATAAITAIWPDITLWALAVIVGIGFLLTGIVELVMLLRFHHELPYRWLFALMALLTIAVGVISLVWPDVTVLVLAVILGVRILMEGLALTSFGLGLRRVHQAWGSGQPA